MLFLFIKTPNGKKQSALKEATIVYTVVKAPPILTAKNNITDNIPRIA
ncbi:MAG: hypothetical protein N4A72_22650 [Bacteroidales bacterium]|nr:hypothetical protein [Bacteroidales bacterium]